MKKKYITPNVRTVLLRGRVHLLSGSYIVNQYVSGGVTSIGDVNED